jgi:hypothetical protein
MWAIHDLHAYGLFLGQVTKGYKGCLAYGPNTSSCHSKILGKLLMSIIIGGYD